MHGRAPTIHIVNFKTLLDVAVIEFFDRFNDSFLCFDGIYHMCETLQLQKIEKFLEKNIISQLKKIVTEYDALKHPDFFIVLGGCQPIDNLLLQLKIGDFPDKLEKILANDVQLKYLLRETDIKIDIVKFNEACCNVFNRFFSSKCKSYAQKNLLFLAHKHLDCAILRHALQNMFGNSNCNDLTNAVLAGNKAPTVAINDLIDVNTDWKCSLNAHPSYLKMQIEVQKFVCSQLNIMPINPVS